MSFYQWQDEDLILFIKVQPKAAKDEIAGIIDYETGQQQLKIRLTAPPVDGKANQHLIKFLSKLFKIAKSDISLLSGETSQHKKLCLHKAMKIPEIIQ